MQSFLDLLSSYICMCECAYGQGDKVQYKWVEPSPFSAIWDVGFTVDASKTRPTGAGVGVDVVCACPSIFAGRTLAFIDL